MIYPRLNTCPAASSHFGMSAEDRLRMGIPDGLIRISFGIEAIEELIGDFSLAGRKPARLAKNAIHTGKVTVETCLNYCNKRDVIRRMRFFLGFLSRESYVFAGRAGRRDIFVDPRLPK